jgi:spore coat protein CotF
MQTFPYGAHEVMELHEVLNTEIDLLNTLQLYLPYVRDPELSQMLHYQLIFTHTEYNHMVHVVHGIGVGAAVPYRPQVQVNLQANDQPHQPVQPNPSLAHMDDRDVASAMLGLHKAGAQLKMRASLEAAHPQIRQMLQQAAINCANQAYEVWGYLQRKGHYPLATLSEAANAQLLRGYQPVSPEQVPAAQVAQPAMPTGGSAPEGTLVSAVEPEPVSHRQPAGVSAPPPAPSSPPPTVSASSLFSSPVYSDEHDPTETEQMPMDTELSPSQAVDPLASLTRQADVRQTRTSPRKKGSSTDSNLSG